MIQVVTELQKFLVVWGAAQLVFAALVGWWDLSESKGKRCERGKQRERL